MVLLAIAVMATTGCPAPFVGDDSGTSPGFDAAAFVVHGDAVAASTGPGNGAAPCDPTAVIDLSVAGARTGPTVRVTVETRGRGQGLRPRCQTDDGPEAVLRYRAPAGVTAVRVTTDDPATDFDTVLAARSVCEPGARDFTCSDNDPDARPRSTVWLTDLTPDAVVFLVLSGAHGARGSATVVLTEYPAEGTLDLPCRPPPVDRPMALNDPSRCDTTESVRVVCVPNTGPDGTDLCLRVEAPGAPCDPMRRHDACDPASDCAVDPQPGGPPPRCALPGTAAGAACRADAPQCDPGFGCSHTAGTTSAGGCLREIPVNGDCDPSRELNVCAPGSTCRVLDADAGIDHCVAA